MSRMPRLIVDNACYHIITRGNQKKSVFSAKEDYLYYLNIVKKAKKKHKILLYGYCLMPNHVHLLIDPESGQDIPKFMHWICRGYAAYFNAKYDKVGHLWQGRFISKPLLKDQYLIHCSNYIEENPVRAGLTQKMDAYLWSSYNERCFHSIKTTLDEINIYG
ncbi:MAG: transposase [Candidatus Omnitrophica bacterium]|nr:transposase [Candidatus Omnitrophota bacterium]